MSTRPIREALELLEMFSGDEKRAREAYDAAMEAVRAIENMAKTLAIQKTQDIRADGMTNAAAMLESIAKEAP